MYRHQFQEDNLNSIKLLGININKGQMHNSIRPLVFSGPSGGGKSTLIKKLFAQFPGKFAFSVSHTTRKPRPGEEDGTDYFFVSRATLVQGIENDEFLEHAEFSGNMYGTSKAAVTSVLSSGRVCILDIDLQGVRKVKKTNLNPLFIFVRPPSVESLRERLEKRKTETDDSLQRRLDTAVRDLKMVENEPNLFDFVVVNDQVDVAYNELLNALKQQPKLWSSITAA